MTEPSPEVVAEVESVCERLGADPAKVHPTGLGHLFDGDRPVEEVGAALDELATWANGTDPRR